MKADKLPGMTLGALLDGLAAHYGSREALVFEEQRITYQELWERANAVAANLLSRGMGKGDRVALLMGNRPEWVITYFACAKLGAVLVPVSTWSTQEEMLFLVEHSQPHWLILTDKLLGKDFVQMLLEISPALSSRSPGQGKIPPFSHLKQIVFLKSEPLPDAMVFDDLLVPPARKAQAALAEREHSVSTKDVLAVVYTSGSTARPKGSVLEHWGVGVNSFNIGERQQLTASDRLWLAVSLFWSFGCCNALPAAMSHGACVVLQEWFDPEKAVRLIARERCTVFYGMANMARALLKANAGGQWDLSSLRTGLSIGAPADIQFMVEELGVSQLCNVYGSTETYGNACVTECDDPMEIRMHTQGKPLPGMEVVIKGVESGEPLPAGELGEICVRGVIFRGYYNDPDTTRACTDAEGFFRSGDLGFFDDDGRLHYQGRIKDMIKTGGLNVSPLEVEQTLKTHANVSEACVVAVPESGAGEIAVAFVSLNPNGPSASEEEIKGYCRTKLSSYKVPVRVIFLALEQLPRTSTGKISKEELRQQARKILQA